MPAYVIMGGDGCITHSANWEFEGSIAVDYDVVRGYDGKLYKSGTEPDGPTVDERLGWLRANRDMKLTDTDKYLMPDYPISTEALEAVKTYRQALRDLPAQPGAPWDGGGEETPWPTKPEI